MTRRNAQTDRADTLALIGRWVRRLLFGLALALAAGALALAVVVWPTRHTVYTNSDSISEPEETALLRDILWEPPALLVDLINSQAHEYEPSITSDGLTLFFVRGKAGENADIYCCRKTHTGWDEPTPLTAVNTEYDELGPELSADGAGLFFYSDRPGGEGGYDLWVARRGLDPGGEFGAAVNLGPAVNSEFNDYGPALTHDGATLYFASNRPLPGDAERPDPEAWSGTIREDPFHRTYDLYSAALGPQGAASARPLTALNTPHNEGAPCVSPFTDFVYFASDRPGGEGAFDLYRTRRVQGRYEPPTNLGPTINTTANELDPGLTMGGYALYFSSDRPVESGPAAETYPYHLYRSNSREVFANIKIERRTIDWTALWARIGPNLLWALLLLLLLLLFVTLVRDLRGRKLSLLTRCLLASLALHLLLMMLLNVWKVTTALAHEFQRHGPIQVALAGPAEGADLVAQVRGEFTALDLPAPAQLASAPRSAKPELEPDAKLQSLKVVHQTHVADTHLPNVRPPADARVESLADAFAPKDSTLENDALDTLELAVPAAADQVATPEAPPSAPTAPRPARSPRPTVQPPDPISVQTVETTPVATATASVPQRSYSLARDGSVREARGTTASAPQLRPAVPTVTHPPPLELAVPRAQPQSTHTENAEARPAPPALKSAATIRCPTPRHREEEEAPALVDAQPASTMPRDDEAASTFVRASQPVADARTAALTASVKPAADATLPTMTPSTLTLPGLAESRSAPAESRSNVPAHARPQSVRRAVEDLRYETAPGDAQPLALAPDQDRVAVTAQPGLAPLVTGPREAVPRAVPHAAQSWEQAPAAYAPSMPAADLTLPALAEVTSSPGEVTAHRPNRLTPDGTRPALDPLFAESPAFATQTVEVAPVFTEVESEEPPHPAFKPADPRFSKVLDAPPPTVAPRPELDQIPPNRVLSLPREVTADAIGTICGRITDAATGMPIVGATIRLDLATENPLEVESGPEGVYVMYPPEVPTFFALSASSPGYLPQAQNVATEMVMGRTHELDFALTPQALTSLALEIEPEVHHLGDNDFDGRINSQFQKRAEGAVYETTFELSAEQLELASFPVELTMLVKGVQMRHRLRFNGQELENRLDWSPSDGSFGMFIVEFDPAVLRPGTNVFKILASSRGSDVDDFEFVNLQINLVPTPVARGGT